MAERQLATTEPGHRAPDSLGRRIREMSRTRGSSVAMCHAQGQDRRLPLRRRPRPHLAPAERNHREEPIGLPRPSVIRPRPRGRHRRQRRGEDDLGKGQPRPPPLAVLQRRFHRGGTRRREQRRTTASGPAPSSTANSPNGSPTARTSASKAPGPGHRDRLSSGTLPTGATRRAPSSLAPTRRTSTSNGFADASSRADTTYRKVRSGDGGTRRSRTSSPCGTPSRPSMCSTARATPCSSSPKSVMARPRHSLPDSLPGPSALLKGIQKGDAWRYSRCPRDEQHQPIRDSASTTPATSPFEPPLRRLRPVLAEQVVDGRDHPRVRRVTRLDTRLHPVRLLRPRRPPPRQRLGRRRSRPPTARGVPRRAQSTARKLIDSDSVELVHVDADDLEPCTHADSIWNAIADDAVHLAGDGSVLERTREAPLLRDLECPRAIARWPLCGGCSTSPTDEMTRLPGSRDRDATALIAALEIGRRHIATSVTHGDVIESPRDLVQLFTAHLRHRKVEHSQCSSWTPATRSWHSKKFRAGRSTVPWFTSGLTRYGPAEYNILTIGP